MRSEYIGRAVAGAGDVNGDGFGDLLVTWFVGDRPAVRLLFGSAAGVSAARSVELRAMSSAESSYGTSLAGLGDVNGDGYADIAVAGAMDALAPPAPLNAGVVSIYWGLASGPAPVPSQRISGMTLNEGLGQGIAGGGDFNGDGFSDVALSAPLADVAFRSFQGQVVVYRGSPSGLVIAERTVLTGTRAGAIDGDLHRVAWRCRRRWLL